MSDDKELAKVAAVAGDPGGASALAPVLQALRAAGRSVVLLAYKQAALVFARHGIPFEDLPETTKEEDARRRLSASRAHVLLTATSCNGVDLEKTFIAAARGLGLPSLAVLDFWSSYRLRFSDAAGNLSYLPDHIAVMDESARQEMIAEGFDAARMHVTGQPAYDELEAYQRRSTPQARKALRGLLGVGPSEMMVLFASQPLATFLGADASNPRYPGYTEQTVLCSLATALDRVARRRQEPIVLVVRPHPRESLDDRMLPNGATAVRLILDRKSDGRNLALTANVVVGMTTNLLVEACLMGCSVVSLQPGLRVPDVLPTNRWGLSRAVFRDADIESALDEMLFAPRSDREPQTRFQSGAARRVVRLLDSLTAAPDSRHEGGYL